MRIVHVMDHSLPKSDGYAIRAKYLLEAQAAAGHDVVVLTGPAQGEGAVDETAAGVRYVRSHYSTRARQLARRGAKQLVFGGTIARALRSLLAEPGTDVVHAHTPFTVARAALREARRARLPFVYEKRNLWEESARARGTVFGRWPLYQIAGGMDRLVTRQADAVCTITESLRAQTVRLGVAAEKVFVVGNGVDIETFTPREPDPEIRRRCAGGRDAFVLGFIGSFFAFEGLPMLVRAAVRLRGRYPGLRVVLVGDGEDFAPLTRLVAELGASEQVWLTGRIPHDQVLDYYSAMDALVYPRYRSVLTELISPLKPLEPMALGRCVVASDVGGMRELIDDGRTGLLFRADDQNDLERRLALLLDGRADARGMGAAAREHVCAHRQWRNMAQVYELAYRRAVAVAQASTKE